MLLFISSAFGQEIYSIKEKGIDGKEYLMSNLKGRVALIVNIASQCGFTYQLEELETLHKKFKDKGLIVLGVPTNDFGGQTPEDDKAMAEFCSKKYNVTFPLLSKKTIEGKDKRDLYKYLTEKTSKKVQGDVAWNFVKYLVNKKGEVIERFSSDVKPSNKEFISKIEAELIKE
jgi:glutathione peroxidase